MNKPFLLFAGKNSQHGGAENLKGSFETREEAKNMVKEFIDLDKSRIYHTVNGEEVDWVRIVDIRRTNE